VAYIFSLENSEFPQESNFTKGNIKCLFLHGSKRGIQFLSGKSSAVFHIKENEGNWKSLPGASYEQRVQRFQWPDITSPFFFFFFILQTGEQRIVSQPCTLTLSGFLPLSISGRAQVFLSSAVPVSFSHSPF